MRATISALPAADQRDCDERRIRVDERRRCSSVPRSIVFLYRKAEGLMKSFISLMVAICTLLSPLLFAAASKPETVFFPSRDGKTELVGYLFLPSGGGTHPGIVMLHGRGG